MNYSDDNCMCAAEKVNEECPRHYDMVKHSEQSIRCALDSINQRIEDLELLITSLKVTRKQLNDIQ